MGSAARETLALARWGFFFSAACVTLLRMANDMINEEAAADNWLLESFRDPSQLGFPPMLPIELALRLDTPQKICQAYNISKDEFQSITKHPVFIKAYSEAVEALKTDGVSFKMKAKLQAEDFLATSYAMVKNANTSDAVRADLIKATARWAGFDAKETAGASGTGFNIQINLG